MSIPPPATFTWPQCMSRRSSMRPATANARSAKRPSTDLLTAYQAHLAATGRGNSAYTQAARSCIGRWPVPQAWAEQPLARRLAADKQLRPFLTFLMIYGLLRPGWD